MMYESNLEHTSVMYDLLSQVNGFLNPSTFFNFEKDLFLMCLVLELKWIPSDKCIWERFVLIIFCGRHWIPK